MANEPNRIPVILVTGFLGSGKTTLLNALLRHPQMADTAVVVNEFGEISIDHLVIESAIENTVVLENGCICCTVRGDLVDTLGNLKQQVARGEVPAFSRVVIETTGLAEPAAIIQTLVTDPMLAGEFRLGLVVTTVDAQHGFGEIERFEEAVEQIAAADLLLVTKSDLVVKAALQTLTEKVTAINPAAVRRLTVQGNLDPDWFMTMVPPVDDEEETLRRWSETLSTFEHEHRGHHEHDHGHDYDHHHFHGAASGIETFSLELDRPLPADIAMEWLDGLLSLRGTDILRLKGVLALEGRDGPVLIQCVQHTAYPPVALDRWPDGPGRTQLVFITRGIDRAGIEASLRAALRARANP
ncbi:GTP-binding protein [Rhizobium sp. P32RR-XVIII]|uniref:CobW family GTP-binding protein n=1 Tax=Rhizobium sp. P32RR-XVIII TaxID=2726738 RepID=UPI001456E92C|nr:GTP-binding protein [Rhizobium sp. P32RR-XVIII]NLS07275.1 GTP-binding protein [Rhizobium sp. P32RR-XVIII]